MNNPIMKFKAGP